MVPMLDITLAEIPLLDCVPPIYVFFTKACIHLQCDIHLAAAMTVDEEELHCIQTSILPTMLPQKLGINRNLPTAIRHGPVEMGGMALTDLRTEMGIEIIKYLRNALFSKSASTTLILTSLKYLQQEAGIGDHLLEFPNINVPYLTPTWVTLICQYMSNHNIAITLTDQFSPQVTRSGDRFLMDPLHLECYTVPQQRDLNLVRLHLQVTLLSDIATTDGKSVVSDFLSGLRPPMFQISSLWPRQPITTAAQQRLWHRYLASTFLRYPPHLLQRIGPPVDDSIDPDPLFPTLLSPNEYDTLSKYTCALPRSHRGRLLSVYNQVCSDVQIWRAFRSRRRLVIANDGGLHATLGTFGWLENRSTR